MTTPQKYTLPWQFVLLIACLCAGAAIQAQQPDSVIIEKVIIEEKKAEPNYFEPKKIYGGWNDRDSVRFRALPDSMPARMKKDDAFWYVDYPFQSKTVQQAPRRVPPMQRPLVQTILWILIIGGFVTFVGIYLANSNVGIFRRRDKSLKEDQAGEEMPENIFEINYDRELDRAIANGDFRLGVRLLFLRLLKQLADRRIIQYQQDRTNFDYILQLQGSAYYTDFFRLTRDYEYSWYGQFEIGSGEFTAIRNDFDNFDKLLNTR